MTDAPVLDILVVNPDYYRSSGVTVAIRRLHAAMTPHPVRYHFVSCLMRPDTAAKPEDTEWMDHPPRRLDLMTKNPLRLLASLWRLWRLVREQRVRILHVHHRRLALLCGWPARLGGARVVYTGHLIYGANRVFRLARIDGAVAITRAIADEIRADHPAALIEVISNIAPALAAADHGDDTVICMARLEPVKNHETLLKAWAQLPDRFGRKLLLMGEGSLRERLETLAAQLGIHDSVVFCGFVKDVGPFIARCDFLVLPSHLEGQPMAILEAATAGKPSLVSDAPGNADTIAPIAGRSLPNLHAPDDAEALAQMLSVWLTDPAARAREGQIFRDYVERHASAQVVGRAHHDLYRALS